MSSPDAFPCIYVSNLNAILLIIFKSASSNCIFSKPCFENNEYNNADMTDDNAAEEPKPDPIGMSEFITNLIPLLKLRII